MTEVSLQEQFLASWREERARVRRANHLCTLATLVITATLFYFLIGLGDSSVSLLALSFFLIFTNLSRLVVYRRYLVPRFFLALRDESEETRAAAWAVIDAHRDAMLAPIVVERRDPSRPEEIARVSAEEVAAWENLDRIDWWARFLRGWLIAWLVTAAGLIAMLASIYLSISR